MSWKPLCLGKNLVKSNSNKLNPFHRQMHHMVTQAKASGKAARGHGLNEWGGGSDCTFQGQCWL